MSDDPRLVDADDELSGVFDHAAPRPRARTEAEAAAFESLHVQWRDLVAGRRRRKVGMLGAAAALVIAIAVGFGVLRESDDMPLGEPVATIERRTGGELSWRDDSARERPIAGGAVVLRVGQYLSTGHDSRIALGWHAGGSLRLNENSEIELVSARSVRLVAGGVYFGSAAGAREPTSAAALAIQTPAGEVLHTGTQFMLAVRGDDVVLSVREGQVRVAGGDFALTVDSGEQLAMNPAGVRERRTVSGSDAAWDWAESIAPEESMDGRNALDILTWAARETGRRIEYDSAATEAATRATIVRGVDRRTPAEMLTLLPLLTDLDVEVRDEAVRVTLR